MGVHICSKDGCDHTGHRYNEEFGYLCGYCFEDLIKYCIIKRDCSLATIGEFMKMHKSVKPFDPDEGLAERIDGHLREIFR